MKYPRALDGSLSHVDQFGGIFLQLRVHRRPSTLLLSTVCANADHTRAKAPSTVAKTCGTISIVLEGKLVFMFGNIWLIKIIKI